MEVARFARQIIKDTVNIPVKKPDRSWFYYIAKFRKLAHVPGYFFLGIAVSLPWVMYTDRIHNVLFRSVFMCFTVSLLDQLVKRFIARREFDTSDMAFDNVGYVMGIVILCISAKKNLTSVDAEGTILRTEQNRTEQNRTEQNRTEQSRADSIDILKAICAFLIVCIHVPFPGTLGAYFTTMTRIAVPIFFMITGYFYSDVVKRGGEYSQIKKILRLVIEANLIYLLWDCFYAVLSEKSISFESVFSIKNLLKFLLLNESPFSGHLWYLGAILYVLIIVLILDKLDCVLYYLTPLLLLGDLVLGKYSMVVWGREFPYILVRNFLFVGIPYFCIGQLIRNGIGRRIEKKVLWYLIVAFSVTSIFERALLVNIGMNATRDHYISTTLLAVTVFLFALKCDGHKGIFAAIGHKHSTWLYILHPIFITCLGAVTNKVGIYGVYKYIAPIIVYIATLVFLVIIEKCKYRIVKRRRI